MHFEFKMQKLTLTKAVTSPMGIILIIQHIQYCTVQAFYSTGTCSDGKMYFKFKPQKPTLTTAAISLM